MRHTLRCVSVLALLAAAVSTADHTALEKAWRPTIQPLPAQHCYDCHDTDVQHPTSGNSGRCNSGSQTSIRDGDSHDANHLPLILCDRGGGTLKPGKVITYDKLEDRRLCNLHLALLNKLGDSRTSFGNSHYPLPGISIMRILLLVLVAALASAETVHEVATRLAAIPYKGVVEVDAQGNPTSLELNHHKMFRKETPERAPVDNAAVPDLARLTTLRSLRMVHQNISDFSFLSAMPDLEVLWTEYVPEGTSPEFVLPMAANTRLHTLAIKHHFKLPTYIAVDRLPTYPHLTTLVLDNGAAGPHCLTFLKANPTITDLELHRTTLGREGLAQVVAMFPGLTRLWIKPAPVAKGVEQIGLADLAVVARLTGLTELGLQSKDFNPLPYEGGLASLKDLRQLKVLHIGSSGIATADPAIVRLQQDLPGLTIVGGR